MKKPSPVPDPIIPEGYAYKIQHFHTGNTKQKNLDYWANIKNCRYMTVCYLFASSAKPAIDEPVSVGFSYCSPLDTPNKKKGIIIATHRAVRSLYPDFYKNLRQNKRK